MPRNDDVKCPVGQWTQLTTTDVTALRAVVLGSGSGVRLQATATSTEPTSEKGGVPLDVGQVLLPDVPLADLFPGVSSAARVWARPTGITDAFVSVSHA